VFIAISILGIIIRYLIKVAALGWIDRICGASFGMIKGILIVSVLLLAFTTFLPKNASIIKDSLLSPHVTMVSEKLAKVIPKDMRDQFSDKLDELKKSWKKLS
jgi:membrane protein required for colicin V production